LCVDIVKDFHFKSLHKRIEPMVLRISYEWTKFAFIRIDSKNVSGTIEFIKGVHQKFNPGYPFEYTFLDEEEIRACSRQVEEAPQRREAQRKLAFEVTRIVHGEDEANKAIAELNGKDFMGRALRVNEARPQSDRPRDDFGGGGGGRGGDRGGRRDFGRDSR